MTAMANFCSLPVTQPHIWPHLAMTASSLSLTTIYLAITASLYHWPSLEVSFFKGGPADPTRWRLEREGGRTEPTGLRGRSLTAEVSRSSVGGTPKSVRGQVRGENNTTCYIEIIYYIAQGECGGYDASIQYAHWPDLSSGSCTAGTGGGLCDSLWERKEERRGRSERRERREKGEGREGRKGRSRRERRERRENAVQEESFSALNMQQMYNHVCL